MRVSSKTVIVLRVQKNDMIAMSSPVSIVPRQMLSTTTTIFCGFEDGLPISKVLRLVGWLFDIGACGENDRYAASLRLSIELKERNQTKVMVTSDNVSML